ncbi:ABC transporter permease [bacterium]|nr:ABC transporter permease [bacterium]
MLGFRIQRTVSMGLKSLWLHKLRAVLTALGIILGVTSVIVMLAVGEGASQAVQAQIRQLGSNNIILRSKKPPEDSSTATATTFALSYGLKYLDAERIKATLPQADVIVPARHIDSEYIVRYHHRVSGTVVGTVPWYTEVAKRTLSQGRFLTSLDMHRRATVCVLNGPIVRKLFPFHDPLGAVVKAGSSDYRVVGVLEGRNAAPGANGAASEGSGVEIYVPITTLQSRYGDTIFKRRSGQFQATQVELHRIIVRSPSLDEVVPISKAVEQILAYGHTKQDYEVVVPLQLLESAEETKRLTNLLLGSIAAISLLVGGIGIMNIMLATVTERTREIGIRRALGARRTDIIVQFLTETILLAAGGGLLGVALGVVLPHHVVTRFFDAPTIVTARPCILAFSVSVGVGLIFGIYPAYRAATMDPIEALRHE